MIELERLPSLSTKFIKEVAWGNAHVLLLTKAGTLYTQGLGTHGVLGHGDEEDWEDPKLLYEVIATHIYATSSTSMALCKVNGDSVGNNEVEITYKAYNDLNNKRSKQKRTCHKDKDLLYVWGHGDEGWLGLGKKQNVLEPMLWPFSLDNDIKQIDCGSKHVMVLTTTNELYSWGRNEFDQLGIKQEVYQILSPQKVQIDSKYKIEYIKWAEFSTGIITSTDSSDFNNLHLWGFISNQVGDENMEGINLPRSTKLKNHDFIDCSFSNERLYVSTWECYNEEEKHSGNLLTNSKKSKLSEENQKLQMIKSWETMIQNAYESNRTHLFTDRIKDLWYNDFPNDIRFSIWKAASGNPSSITQEYFKMLMARGEKLGKILMTKSDIEKIGKPEHDPDYLRSKMEYNLMALSPGESHEDSIVIIENDLPRTFPTINYFKSDNDKGKENVKTLRKLLRAFTWIRPDVGYVQGMSYI